MIIHSIVPCDSIFASAENVAATEFMPIKHGFLEIEKGKPKRVIRVISTDPKDYLKKDYQPF